MYFHWRNEKQTDWWLKWLHGVIDRQPAQRNGLTKQQESKTKINNIKRLTNDNHKMLAQKSY